MEETIENTKCWYALQVTTGYEKHAHVCLMERVESNDMEDNFGEILIPTEKRFEFKRGVKKEIEEKIFPGYLFVQMEMDSACWHLVVKTRWIKGFIGGTAESPRPLSEEEITSIQNRIGDNAHAPTLRSKFIVGEQVHIKDGPFDDFNGTVESVNNERERLTVAVMVFGRSTPVELDFSQVEKE